MTAGADEDVGPAEAAQCMARAVADGASAVCTVLLDAPEGVPGRRLVVVRHEDGREDVLGSLGRDAWDALALATARAALDDPAHGDGLHTPGDGLELYLEIRRPAPELVIVGAGHIARPLCSVGALLGFRVLVLDDRPDFATRERFPEADRLIQADFSDPFADVALHRHSHILLVTRGHKYDYECLRRVMKRPLQPAYIGMIGSRRRVRATFVQLLEEGTPRDRLEAIHAPVGLDVRAETPEEIAVAVAAELVMVRRGGTGRPLREVEEVARRFFPDEATP